LNPALEYRLVPKPNGEWIEVIFRDPDCYQPLCRWRPAIKDLARMLVGIGLVEDRKYPNGQGRFMLAELVERILREHIPTGADVLIDWDSVWLPYAQEYGLRP